MLSGFLYWLCQNKWDPEACLYSTLLCSYEAPSLASSQMAATSARLSCPEFLAAALSAVSNRSRSYFTPSMVPEDRGGRKGQWKPTANVHIGRCFQRASTHPKKKLSTWIENTQFTPIGHITVSIRVKMAPRALSHLRTC